MQWIEIIGAAVTTAGVFSILLGFLVKRLISQYDARFDKLDVSMTQHEQSTTKQIERLDQHIQRRAEVTSTKVNRVHKRIDGLVEQLPRDYIRRPEQDVVLAQLDRIEKKVGELQTIQPNAS